VFTTVSRLVGWIEVVCPVCFSASLDYLNYFSSSSTSVRPPPYATMADNLSLNRLNNVNKSIKVHIQYLVFERLSSIHKRRFGSMNVVLSSNFKSCIKSNIHDMTGDMFQGIQSSRSYSLWASNITTSFVQKTSHKLEFI
jgi:hypothetical protein